MTNSIGCSPVRIKNNRRSVEQEFLGGKRFSLDVRAISERLYGTLSPRMLDFLRIASTVYFADRLIHRERGKGSDKWSRNISCLIGLQDNAFWGQVEIRELLEHTLGLVSGDKWILDFVADCDSTDQQVYLPDMGDLDHPPVMCLYSGGLDSAAGLARRLSEGTERQVLPVVVRHRSDLGDLATRQLQVLGREFKVDLEPAIVPVDIVSAKEIRATESSQRARSFLFVSVGGVVAWAMNASTLEIYESGIGAVNAPLLAGMEGSQATRSCHPHFLRLMSKLLSLAAEKPIEIALPFKMMTKGEVTSALADQPLQKLARSTVSCMSYPLRQEVGKSCGLCPACLFRRVALHAAGIPEASDTYQFDILDGRSSPSSRRKMKYLKAFLLLVDQLWEVDRGRLPIPLSRHLTQTGILESGESRRPYVDLYRRYRQEWFSFLHTARANGCKWVNLIDLPEEAA